MDKYPVDSTAYFNESEIFYLCQKQSIDFRNKWHQKFAQNAHSPIKSLQRIPTCHSFIIEYLDSYYKSSSVMVEASAPVQHCLSSVTQWWSLLVVVPAPLGLHLRLFQVYLYRKFKLNPQTCRTHVHCRCIASPDEGQREEP